MGFKIKPSPLTRRKKIIEDGVEAAARWPKDIRDQYIHRPVFALRQDQTLDNDFLKDMICAQKAYRLTGKLKRGEVHANRAH